MREFILLMDQARTDHDFSIKNLSANGRMDIACRFINSTLFNSYKMRDDVKTRLLLRGPPRKSLSLELDGRNLQGLHPGERSIAGYLKKNLKSFEDRKTAANVGVRIEKENLEDVLDRSNGKPVVLHEEGRDISDVELPEHCVFVIGDHKGVSEEDMEKLREYNTVITSLGCESYQAQQVSSFLNIYMDRNG